MVDWILKKKFIIKTKYAVMRSNPWGSRVAYPTVSLSQSKATMTAPGLACTKARRGWFATNLRKVRFFSGPSIKLNMYLWRNRDAGPSYVSRTDTIRSVRSEKTEYCKNRILPGTFLGA